MSRRRSVSVDHDVTTVQWIQQAEPCRIIGETATNGELLQATFLEDGSPKVKEDVRGRG